MIVSNLAILEIGASIAEKAMEKII